MQVVDDIITALDDASAKVEENLPPRWRRVLLWTLGGLFLLIALSIAAVQGLNTGPGRAWLARQLATIAPESGLTIAVGRLDGSLFGRLTIRDLKLGDPKGVFLVAPRIDLDWDPARLWSKRVHLSFVEADDVRLLRQPALRDTPRDPDKPLLPDINIHLGRLTISRLHLDAPVAGRAATAVIDGKASLYEGRALVDLDARTADGFDQLEVRLDAAPDQDQLDIAARIAAPKGGIIAGLLKLDAPLALTLNGKGSWARWRGRLDARLGEAMLADLSLGAKAGRFDITGRAAPSLMLGGLLQRLSSPVVDIQAGAILSNDRNDLALDIFLGAPAAALTAKGGLDLDRSRIKALDLRFDVRRPDAIRRDLSGRAMRLELALDGPMAGPDLRYRLSADQLAIGTTRFAPLTAAGEGALDSDTPELSFDARTEKVTGISQLAEDLLTGLRLSGPLTIREGRLEAGELLVKSKHIDAGARLNINMKSGAYLIDLKGGVKKYPMAGVGLVDLDADWRITPDDRRIRAQGKTDVRLGRVDSRLFQSLFKGTPRITTMMDRRGDGIITFSNLRLNAPDMTASGSGRLLPGSLLELRADGVSRTYGAFSTVLAGPIARPKVDLALRAYRAGILLRQIKATLTPENIDYRFTANAATDYGPLIARGLIQPSQIAIDTLRLAGLNAQGPLRFAENGRFQGRLAITGVGINGHAQLSAENGDQRINARLAASNGQIGFATPLVIRNGQMDVAALLSAQPVYDISFDGKRITYGKWRIDSAQGVYQLNKKRGALTAALSGRHGAPFTLKIDSKILPDQIEADLSGSIAKQALRLDRPARLEQSDSVWKLAPVTLILPNGRATLAGSFGDHIQIDSKLDSVGLDVISIFNPELSITGKASGTLALTLPSGGGLPQGDAKIVVRGFSRASLASTARPIDVGINARLDRSSGSLRAIFRNEARIFGRAQAVLRPIPGTPADSALERLLAAPLTAQVRWSGPSGPLWAVTGIEAFDVRGILQLAVDISGDLGDPVMRGTMSSPRARIESTTLGMVVNDIDLAARFDGSRLIFDRFTGKDGTNDKTGTITGSGYVDLSFDRRFPMRLDLALDKAQVMNRDDLRSTVTGPLTIENGPDGALISGDLSVDRARFRLGTATATEFAEIQVGEKNRDLVQDSSETVRPTIWQLDVRARANNKIDVRGMGLDSEWSADLVMHGAATRPQLSGTARLIRGEYEFAGKTFELQRGSVRFTGTYPPDPIVDIVAESRVQGLTATLNIRGTALKPEIRFSSVPALPEDEVLSRVLFGNSLANLSAGEALQLAGAVAALRSGGGGGLDPVGAIRKAIGLDRLRFSSGNDKNGSRTSIAAGEYLTDRVYVEVAADGQGFAATQIEVELTRSLSILSALSAISGSSINLRWSKDY